MANKNEINEIFSYLAKNNEIPGDRLAHIHNSIYGAPAQTDKGAPPAKSLPTAEFEARLSECLGSKNINEELLYLFYSLDREKKGYLTPEDILAVFRVLDKPIGLGEIENSFKYAKVYKNKMTF